MRLIFCSLLLVSALGWSSPVDNKQEMKLRVMTYNVHSCKGMDGQVRPDRIAQIISEAKPDVVVLQEIRVGRVEPETATKSKTHEEGVITPPVGEAPLPPPVVVPPRKPSDSEPDVPFVNQPRRIANQLNMYYVFYPLVRMKTDDFGIAVLSKYPLTIVRAQNLPTLPRRKPLERRGAIWVEIEVDGHPVQLVGTHLGLRDAEKQAQVEALLGPEFLGDSKMKFPYVFCGDLNSHPSQKPYKRLAELLMDAPAFLKQEHNTFPSFFPMIRIDHVFVPRQIGVLHSDVIKNSLTRQASDHIPLVVDLDIRKI